MNKKIFVLMFCMIFLVGTITALEFDNTKQYDKANKEYTIKNAFGYGKDLATIQLIDYTPYCLPEDCWMYMKVTVHENGLQSYKSSKYYDKHQTKELKNKDRHIEIYDPDYVHDYIYTTEECIEIGGNRTKVCEVIEKVGTKTGGYVEYKPSTKLREGEYIIREKVDVEAGETVDLVPNFYGLELTEWADFTGLARFEFYTTGDDTNNGVRGSRSLGQTFIHGYSGTNNNVEVKGFSIRADMGSALAEAYIYDASIYPANATGGHLPTGRIAHRRFNATIEGLQFGSINWVNITFEQNGTLINGTTYGLYINSTENYGGSDDLQWRLDETAATYGGGQALKTTNYSLDDWVFDTGDFMFEIWGPGATSVTLNNPANNSLLTSQVVEFSCTGTSGGAGVSMTNVSLFTDKTGSFVLSNITTGLSSSTEVVNMTLNFTADGIFNWSCEACSSDGTCAFGTTNRTLTIDSTAPAVTLISPATLEPFGFSGKNESVNWTVVETNPDTCRVDYNGTNATVGCFANHTTFLVDQPRTIIFHANDTAGATTSLVRPWQYIIFQNSSTFSEVVRESSSETFQINITYNSSEYNSISSNLIYNGTSRLATKTGSGDTLTFTRVLEMPLVSASQNRTFLWEFILSNSSETLFVNSTENSQTTEPTSFGICSGAIPTPVVNYTIFHETSLIPINATFKGTASWSIGNSSLAKNASFDLPSNSSHLFCISPNDTYIVDFEIDLAASGFAPRTFNLENQNYSNNSLTTQPLYLLNTTETASIIIEVRDEGLQPLPGYLVEILRVFPESGNSTLVESKLTDDFGIIVADLIKNDVSYKFKFYNPSGTLVKETERTVIACQQSICILQFTIESLEDDFERLKNITSLDSTLSFNNNTNTFTFSWNDATGELNNVRLLVERKLLNGTEIVAGCNVTAVADSGSLTCNVGNQSASYTAQSFRTADGKNERRLSVLSVKVGDVARIFGLEGLIWGFILLMTLIAVGSFSPTVGVVLYLAGFIMLGILGVISVNPAIIIAQLVLGVLFIIAIRT